jgi:hypothetical protein
LSEHFLKEIIGLRRTNVANRKDTFAQIEQIPLDLSETCSSFEEIDIKVRVGHAAGG